MRGSDKIGRRKTTTNRFKRPKVVLTAFRAPEFCGKARPKLTKLSIRNRKRVQRNLTYYSGKNLKILGSDYSMVDTKGERLGSLDAAEAASHSYAPLLQ